MKLTAAKKQKAIKLFPHVLAGVAVMLDVPVNEFEQWVMSLSPSVDETEKPQKAKLPTLRERIETIVAEHPDWHGAQIAEHLGVGESSVRGIASKYKIKLKAKRETGNRVIDKIRKSLANNPNYTARQIADEWGLKPTVINQAAKANGVKIRRIAGPKATPKKPTLDTSRPMRREPAVKPIVRQVKGTRFYLRDDAGQYLHQSCEGMTPDRTYAWNGLEKQIVAVRKKFVLAKNLREVVVL